MLPTLLPKLTYDALCPQAVGVAPPLVYDATADVCRLCIDIPQRVHHTTVSSLSTSVRSSTDEGAVTVT